MSIALGIDFGGTKVLAGVVNLDTGEVLHHESVQRDRLWAVQTPQAFKSSPLLAAYQAAAADGFTGTDTAACVERFEGVPVQVVSGDPRNIKVTYADDLFTAELILTTSGYEL